MFDGLRMRPCSSSSTFYSVGNISENEKDKPHDPVCAEGEMIAIGACRPERLSRSATVRKKTTNELTFLWFKVVTQLL